MKTVRWILATLLLVTGFSNSAFAVGVVLIPAATQGGATAQGLVYGYQGRCLLLTALHGVQNRRTIDTISDPNTVNATEANRPQFGEQLALPGLGIDLKVYALLNSVVPRQCTEEVWPATREIARVLQEPDVVFQIESMGTDGLHFVWTARLSASSDDRLCLNLVDSRPDKGLLPGRSGSPVFVGDLAVAIFMEHGLCPDRSEGIWVLRLDAAEEYITIANAPQNNVPINLDEVTAYALARSTPVVDEAAGTITLTITRQGLLPQEILTAYTVADRGTNNVGDFEELTGRQLTFPADIASLDFSIQINNDSILEPDETFAVEVRRGTSVLASAAFTIRDVGAARFEFLAAWNDTMNSSECVTRANQAANEAVIAIGAAHVEENEVFWRKRSSDQLAFSLICYPDVPANPATFVPEARGRSLYNIISYAGDTIVAERVQSYLRDCMIASNCAARLDLPEPQFSRPEIRWSARWINITPQQCLQNANTYIASTITAFRLQNMVPGQETSDDQSIIRAEREDTSVHIYCFSDMDQPTRSSRVLMMALTISSSPDTLTPISDYLDACIADVCPQRSPADYALVLPTATINELDGQFTFEIARPIGRLAETLSIVIVDATDGIQAPGDFTPLEFPQIDFATGQISRTIAFTVVNDTVVERSKGFRIQLLSNNAPLATAEFTIRDDDLPTYEIVAATPVVVEDRGTSLQFTVTRTAAYLPRETITVSVADDQGFLNGNDYLPTNRTLTLAEGIASATFFVTVIDDSIREPDETFSARAVAAGGRVATTTFVIHDQAIWFTTGAWWKDSSNADCLDRATLVADGAAEAFGITWEPQEEPQDREYWLSRTAGSLTFWIMCVPDIDETFYGRTDTGRTLLKIMVFSGNDVAHRTLYSFLSGCMELGACPAPTSPIVVDGADWTPPLWHAEWRTGAPSDCMQTARGQVDAAVTDLRLSAMTRLTGSTYLVSAEREDLVMQYFCHADDNTAHDAVLPTRSFVLILVAARTTELMTEIRALLRD